MHLSKRPTCFAAVFLLLIHSVSTTAEWAQANALPNKAQDSSDAGTEEAKVEKGAEGEAPQSPPKPPATERSDDREVQEPESQGSLPNSAADVQQPVGSFEELKRLKAKFPNAMFRVSIKASVNHWDRFQKKLFLQQDQHARHVTVPDSFHQSALRLRLGSQVRVIGEFDCSENRLVGEEIRKLKAGPIPKALEIDLSANPLGEHWGRRVTGEGKVEAVLFEKKRCQLLLQQGQRRYLARLEQNLVKRQALGLIGSRVRFTGTLDYVRGTFGHPITPIVHAVFEDDFEIVEPANSELHTWTRIGLAEENTGLAPSQLAELRGQVTFLRKHDQLVIEDAEGRSTSIYSCFLHDVRVGDEVCVYALPVQPTDANKPRLTPRSDRLGIGTKWRALVIERITPGFLNNMHLSPGEIVNQQLFLRRATVQGNLNSVRSDHMNYFLRLSEGNHQFVARVHATVGQFNALRLTNSSRLAVTGLVEERLDNGESGDFQLRVASLDDISVLKPGKDSGDPLFWVVVGVLLSLVMVGTGLVWKLRGQVGEQSEDMALLIARLNATYDAVREGLLAVDERGRVLTVNPQFRELVGVEISPQGGDDLEPNWIVQQIANRFQSSEAFLNAWQQTRNAPESTLTMELLTVDPQPRTLVVFTAPVSAPTSSMNKERLENRIWTFEDVSERKQLEADLIQSQKMEAVGRLAGGVAHDFNNLLLAITANLELARMQSEFEPNSEYLEAAERAVERATKLVKHLLGFSRKSVLELRVRDPNEVVRRIESLLDRILNAEIVFRVDLAGGIWNVNMDDTHIEQVLLNLCLNARDACLGSESLIEITTSNLSSHELAQAIARGELPPTRERDYVRITVQDNGTGINEDVLEKVFDPFFTTKEQGKGTGLGLSMSLGIVEQHEGVLHLDSKPGQGTRCDLLLPRTLAPINPADSQIGRLEKTDIKFANILLADDDELVRESTANALKANGYAVTSVSNGVDALIHLRSSSQFAVAIVDFSMPGMSAVDLFQRIREYQSELPLIVTSGYSIELDAIEEQAQQPVNFLAKPYRTVALVDAINQAVAPLTTDHASKTPDPSR